MKYGFFSDVHSNDEALTAVAKDFEEQKLDKIYFLGDAVGYGASPNECVKLISQVTTKCLMGNHDYASLGLLDTDFFNQYAKDSINWTKTILNDKILEILSNYLLCCKQGDFHMVHSTPKEPENWHYILNLSEAEEKIRIGSRAADEILYPAGRGTLLKLSLAIMGLLASQMLYKWKMNLPLTTAIVVVVTLAAMILGPFGQTRDANNNLVQGPVGKAVVGLNNAINTMTGNKELYTVTDPTAADPRIPAPGADGTRPATAVYDPATGLIKTMPAYLLWALFLFVFSYLGANLPIWRFAQPVNYIGFWITLIVIVLSAVGAVLAPLTGVKDAGGAAIGAFALAATKDLGFTLDATKAWQPLWPMLFVTIACGAISGWHALFGSVGTARQLEYETDALPVGGGAMFSENTLALLSLVAVSIAGSGGGGGRFAAGVGKLLYAATFSALPEAFGTALGFGAFVVIVLTVVQLVFRVMRVTLTEWVGEAVPAVKNMHVSTVISMVLTLALVLTGTWVYLWQLFGASNQLMAALSLLLVTVWLKSEKRNPAYALWPMLFMYITTLAATVVTARNLYVTIATKTNLGTLPVVGAWAMILVAILLIVAALFIGYDGWVAYQRYARGETPAVKPAPAGD